MKRKLGYKGLERSDAKVSRFVLRGKSQSALTLLINYKVENMIRRLLEKLSFMFVKMVTHYRKTFFLFLFSYLTVSASPKENNEFEQLAVITVPKSGTHLICKLINFFGVTYSAYHPSDFLKAKKKFNKKIILIRDPRDTCISWVNHVDKHLQGKWEVNPLLNKRPEFAKKLWRNRSFNEKLTATILGPSLKTLFMKVYPHFNNLPLCDYEIIVSLTREPNTLVCRFENLVGEKGGGTLQKQKEEILKIAKFIGFNLTQEKLNIITASLFGNTKTFYKGQIGKWRELFHPEHKAIFKEKRNHLLVYFGYEENSRW